MIELLLSRYTINIQLLSMEGFDVIRSSKNLVYFFKIIWKLILLYKGVYPQSDESLATVDIDASKGFVDLWVHLSFAIFAIFDVKRELKLLEMACDQIQTCLIFPCDGHVFLLKLVERLSGNTYFQRFFFSLTKHFLYENVNMTCFILKWQNYIKI